MPPTKPLKLFYRSCNIHSLPVELLSRIFSLGAGFEYPYEDSPFLLKPNQDTYPPPPLFQLLVSHVCQQWRYIVLRTPALWATLHLREPVHVLRARAYLERCSRSSTYLLDILVDTVASEDHIPGVTLCRKEIEEVFKLIIPHVRHWRSFHLKIRDNECKLQARHYLSTCGPAPCLETLQLYHFEDYGTSQNLYLATYRPPVVVFDNNLPKLRNVSLIGVNLPWQKSPYLANLHQLELALHPDSIRPPYNCWERMLRLSPELKSLYLHYSGPRLGSGESKSDWPVIKEKIALDMLSELKLTDLDPDYLCEMAGQLYLPNAQKMSWDLPEQDFSSFIELLTQRADSITIAEYTVPPRRPSKIAISSLVLDSEAELTDGVVGKKSQADAIFAGPLPYLSRLTTLVITALECSLSSWQSLLLSLDGLKHLEVDFRRVGHMFWKVFAGTVEVDESGVVRQGSERVLLSHLKLIKVSGVLGMDLRKEMHRRARYLQGDCLSRWMIRWSPVVKGDDPILDDLAQAGLSIGDRSLTFQTHQIQIETFYEDDEDEVEEELEPGDSPDEGSD